MLHAIFEAVLREVARVGYAAMRFEDIAESAGVAKTTLYRRYPTKADLLSDAVRCTKFSDPLPDTGSLREDLYLLLERTLKMARTAEGRALASLIQSEGSDPEINRLARSLKDESRKHRLAIITRAQERGHLPPDVDGMLMLDAIFAVVFSRVIRFGEKMDRPECERLIDLVVTGAEAGAGRLPRPSRSRGEISEPPKSAPRATGARSARARSRVR